jgi:hypothetical protein
MATPSPAPQATVEQYKAYLQDLGNIGTRYTTSNGFYLSVVTALLGILSLMKPGQGLADLQNILRIAVPLFAIGLCFVWRKTLRFYSDLFGAKFAVLKEMEQSGGLFPAYEREYELLPKQWLIDNEARIPLFLALPFLVILVYTVWKLVTHWT